MSHLDSSVTAQHEFFSRSCLALLSEGHRTTYWQWEAIRFRSTFFIGETAGQATGEALKVNSTLQTLNLSSNNDLGETGSEVIAEALKVNSTLQTLDLQGNDFGETAGHAIFLKL